MFKIFHLYEQYNSVATDRILHKIVIHFYIYRLIMTLLNLVSVVNGKNVSCKKVECYMSS